MKKAIRLIIIFTAIAFAANAQTVRLVRREFVKYGGKVNLDSTSVVKDSTGRLIPSFLNAQCNEREAYFKNGDLALKKILQKKFSEEVKAHNVDFCLISVTFAKFQIDTAGNIEGLTFCENHGTPPECKDILTSVINNTNGMWAPRLINGKVVKSKPFILPLIYDMESACKVQAPDGTSAALLNFLDFKDDAGNKISQLDCVLLSPLTMYSQN